MWENNTQYKIKYSFFYTDFWAKDCTNVPLCLLFSQTVMKGYNYICVFLFYPPKDLFIAYIKET